MQIDSGFAVTRQAIFAMPFEIGRCLRERLYGFQFDFHTGLNWLDCEVGLCLPLCRTLLLGRPHGPRRNPTLSYLGKRALHAHQATYTCPQPSTYAVACGHIKSFKMGRPPSSKSLPIPFLPSSPALTVKRPSLTPHCLCFLCCPVWSSRARKSTQSSAKSNATPPPTSHQTTNLC
jgi:hypothetical protein